MSTSLCSVNMPSNFRRNQSHVFSLISLGIIIKGTFYLSIYLSYLHHLSRVGRENNSGGVLEILSLKSIVISLCHA